MFILKGKVHFFSTKSFSGGGGGAGRGAGWKGSPKTIKIVPIAKYTFDLNTCQLRSIIRRQC